MHETSLVHNRCMSNQGLSKCSKYACNCLGVMPQALVAGLTVGFVACKGEGSYQRAKGVVLALEGSNVVLATPN